MKRLACYNFLFILLLFSYIYGKSDSVIKLLETGKINEVKKIINSITDEEYKNFLISLCYLYNGEYEQSTEFALKLSAEWCKNDKYVSANEKNFFITYIFNIRDILRNGYKEYESENFRVWLKGKDEILKNIILQKLEQIYNFYNKIFDFYPQEKIRVEVYNTKEEFYFASTLGKDVVERTGVVGICKFNKIMILSPENLPLGYRWCDTLAHEYIHFLLNRITDCSYPLYLHEGTARYFDTLYRSTESLCFSPGNLKLLLDARNENRLIPLNNIKGSLAYLDSKQQVELAFTQLASFVEYLIKNFGIENFVKFIKKYKEYENNERKLYLHVFGASFENIVEGWLKYIDTKSDIVKMYPGAQPDIKIFTAEDENVLIKLDIKQYIELGDKFLSSKNYNAALYQYKKAQQIEMYNCLVLTRIGKTNILLKRYNDAKNVLRKCIQTNPNFVTAYELMVKVCYETGEYNDAIEMYKQVLEINPFNYEIRKLIANIFADLGRLRDAISEYEVVVLLDPSDEKSRTILDSMKRYLELKNKK